MKKNIDYRNFIYMRMWIKIFCGLGIFIKNYLVVIESFNKVFGSNSIM